MAGMMGKGKGPKRRIGSGGNGRRALEGHGPTPRAEDRPYHKAYRPNDDGAADTRGRRFDRFGGDDRYSRPGGFRGSDGGRSGGWGRSDEGSGAWGRSDSGRYGGDRGGRSGYGGGDRRRFGDSGRGDGPRDGGYSRDGGYRSGGFRAGDSGGRSGGFRSSDPSSRGGFRDSDSHGGFKESDRGDVAGGFRDEARGFREGGGDRRFGDAGARSGGSWGSDDRRGGFERSGGGRYGDSRGGGSRYGDSRGGSGRGGYGPRDRGYGRDGDSRGGRGGYGQRGGDSHGGYGSRGDSRGGYGQRGGDRRDSGDWVMGRNAVLEAMEAGVPAKAVYVAEGTERDDRLEAILRHAGENDVPLLQASRYELDRMVPGVHQGVALQIKDYAYVDVADLLEHTVEAGGMLVACDQITDPHNLGAIVRSTAAFGGAGVIIPERRSASMTAAAWKASAGAAAVIAVSQVTNLNRALEEASQAGFTVVGLAGDGENDLDDVEVDADAPILLVVGSEGDGLSRLVREHCDAIIRIPVSDAVESLNASVACGVVLYALTASRRPFAPTAQPADDEGDEDVPGEDDEDEFDEEEPGEDDEDGGEEEPDEDDEDDEDEILDVLLEEEAEDDALAEALFLAHEAASLDVEDADIVVGDVVVLPDDTNTDPGADASTDEE